MRRVTKTKLMALAESWANEAGTSLTVRGTVDEHKLLTNTDPTVRALWRCALQLADLVGDARAIEDGED